jgi:sucrose-phosphate synthase
LEKEEVQRVANRRWEREQVRRDATEDMSEDLSEGEKVDNVVEMVQCDTPRKRFQRQISNLEVWSDDKNEKKLYIVLIRYHIIFTPLIFIFNSHLLLINYVDKFLRLCS